MKTMNATFFAAASNMSPDQIQQLFSPVAPGKYANNLVFPSSANNQDAIFRAIEALRQANPSNNNKPVAAPSSEMLPVYG